MNNNSSTNENKNNTYQEFYELGLKLAKEAKEDQNENKKDDKN